MQDAGEMLCLSVENNETDLSESDWGKSISTCNAIMQLYCFLPRSQMQNLFHLQLLWIHDLPSQRYSNWARRWLWRMKNENSSRFVMRLLDSRSSLVNIQLHVTPANYWTENLFCDLISSPCHARLEIKMYFRISTNLLSSWWPLDCHVVDPLKRAWTYIEVGAWEFLEAVSWSVINCWTSSEICRPNQSSAPSCSSDSSNCFPLVSHLKFDFHRASANNKILSRTNYFDSPRHRVMDARGNFLLILSE